MGTSYKELFRLYDIIQNGDERSVKRFLEDTTVQINQILPCKGIGVLHLAVGIEPLEKSKKCTEMLLRHGGDPNICNDDGVTPVHIAAIWGRAENLKLLIGCGGDPSRKDLDGHSAFDYAVREEQWDVYDYLHNVMDPVEDSLGAKCGFTLDLEKVLLTTDQLVAEYGPIPEDPPDKCPSYRKSELINEWCEKNCLALNKIYPTILGETYLIENETVPWHTDASILTSDLTKERISSDSFRTCLSKKSEGIISGVFPISETDLTKVTNKTNELNQRISVYEHFSLPGSPKIITHRNYNTKTCIKKCDTISNDSSHLDKVLALVQNKTNEFISNCGGNTRRSSASSGVSSNSGGSIVIASVHEEYRYEDKEEDVVLIEKRLLVPPVVLSVEDTDISPDHTVMSVASSLPPSVKYDDNTLRAELIRLGFTPGPILDTTRNLYLKKLQTLKKQGNTESPKTHTESKRTYSIEIEKSLRSNEWVSDLKVYMDLESKARANFSDSSVKWREGTAKTSFTYLLLDPRITDNLPTRAEKQDEHASWVTFVNSIFYVGKGKRSRPYSHLYQALTLWKQQFKSSRDKKVQHILDIWSEKVGVVCLHVFQNVIPAEAYTYEACMIDALGINSLKNLKNGNYYGVVASWPLKERRMLGLYLLYKAMKIFLNEGERQLKPEDLD